MSEPLDLIDALVADWRRERPASAPEAMQVVGRVVRLGRRYEEEVARMLRAHGLSYSDFDVIATLRRSGAPYALGPAALQKNVILTSGAMTACLRRLETAGLISRKADKDDRRRLSARLTGKGFALVEELIDQRFELARQALSGLDESQVALLGALLRNLASNGDRPA